MNLEPASSGPDAQVPPAPGATAPNQDAGAGTPLKTIRKKFVLFAAPQTRAARLVHMLDQHPRIRCLDEVFSPRGTVLEEFGLRTEQAMAHAGANPVDFLERLVAQVDAQPGARPLFGFKMMLHHDPRMINYFIDAPQWAVVVVERRDMISQWLETALIDGSAKDRGGNRGRKNPDDDDDDGDDDADDGFIDDEEGAPAVAPVARARTVTFDPWRFEQFGFRMQAQYQSIYHRLRKRDYFRLFSEDVDTSLAALYAFLGVEDVPLREQPTPAWEPSARTSIENFDVFAKYCRKNALAIR
jgi:hypothetical protein